MAGVGVLALRVSLVYVVLLILLRLVGKRTVKEATPFDFVVALIVGDCPDDVIWGEVPMAQGLVAVGTILLLHSIVLYAIDPSERLDRLVGSGPRTIVREGAPLPARLRRERISADTLRSALRERGIADLGEVSEVRVEPSGRLSVRQSEQAKPADRRDLPALAALLRRGSPPPR